ncbi:hypothetical protein RB195_011353 [Necator americanus]|uniref:Uncharacterized protein n=1 Tax=Necator americanus TaxID=51031 RepID=A0ABR1D2U9_NECAM
MNIIESDVIQQTSCDGFNQLGMHSTATVIIVTHGRDRELAQINANKCDDVRTKTNKKKLRNNQMTEDGHEITVRTCEHEYKHEMNVW